MPKLVLKKGNLYNQLEGRLDNNLIDSSEYDLEVTSPNEQRYYRIRYIDSSFVATEIAPNTFHIPKNRGEAVLAKEVANFKKTKLFERQFPYKKMFLEDYHKQDDKVPSYYAFLQRITGKNHINNPQTLYDFTIPALGNREKNGILSYDIHIELVKNRYYLVFFQENVKKGYFQGEETQYIIYERDKFLKAKGTLEENVLNLAIEEDYSLNLLEYAYLMSGGDKVWITKFFNDLKHVRNLDNFYNKESFPIIKGNLQRGEELFEELLKYLNGEQEDIHYSYKNSKRLMLKK